MKNTNNFQTGSGCCWAFAWFCANVVAYKSAAHKKVSNDGHFHNFSQLISPCCHILLLLVILLLLDFFVRNSCLVTFCGHKKDLVESSSRVSFELINKFNLNLAPGLIYLDKLSPEKLSRFFKKHMQKIGNFYIRKNVLVKTFWTSAIRKSLSYWGFYFIHYFI